MLLFAVMFAFSTTFVACGGGEATEETAEETTEVTDETATVDFTKGKEVYAANCQVCHQGEGAGLAGAFPTLKGLTITKDEVIKNIKEGKNTGKFPAPMVPVAISDEDASAVADYVLSMK